MQSLDRKLDASEEKRVNCGAISMRVLLVDDHALFLEGLHNLLTVRGIQVVGTARDGLEALEKTRLLAPDLILMDIRMPRCDGLAATRLIKAECQECKIVILTTSIEEEDLFEAIKSGACGYLLKSLQADPFVAYLEGVMRGEAVIPPEMGGALFKEFARQSAVMDELSINPKSGQESPTLTPRQRQILELITKGLTYKEVANKLNLSEHTIKYHMGEILRCLHLKNREQVVAYALKMGQFKGTQQGPD